VPRDPFAPVTAGPRDDRAATAPWVTRRQGYFLRRLA